MKIVAYGGGTNSTAMLVGLYERGIKPDLILFADTGAENPRTYEHIIIVNEWLEKIGFPQIITVMQVKSDGTPNPLYEYCIEKKALPSIAYGYKTCSQKHKIAPQDKYVNNLEYAKDIWKAGNKITRFIGYDANEHHRIGKNYSNDKYIYEYPLVDWGWGRDECIEAIKRAGLPQAGKSACFFCPSSKPKEILQLKREYPLLMKKALYMESNAELTSVKGLGRNFSWADLVKYDDDQLDMFAVHQEIPCGCYDGE
jgi:hypothetical protein